MWFLGVSDEVRVCARCGGSDLAQTLAFEREDGAVVHYGADCATAATGKELSSLLGELKSFEAQSVWLAEQEPDYSDATKAFAIAVAEAEKRWPVGRRREDRAARAAYAYHIRRAKESQRTVRDRLIGKQMASFRAAVAPDDAPLQRQSNWR